MAEPGLWYEITARVPPADAELAADMMRQVSPRGVTVEEPIDALGPEMGYRVREGEPIAIRAYVPSSELGAVLLQRLRDSMQDAFPAVDLVAKPVYEQDWEVAWRDFFGVVRAGRIVIVPSWLEHETDPGDLVLRLDPGRAFGTGHHETTRLCLLALQDAVRPGDHVIDIGTGSGILSIAAVLLGASTVTGLDTDPIAVDVARENCRENGVQEQVRLAVGTLCPGDEIEHAAVAVANISRQANVELAPAFPHALAPGGRLIVSGILAEDNAAVRGAIEDHGFTLATTRHESDWALLEFTRDS